MRVLYIDGDNNIQFTQMLENVDCTLNQTTPLGVTANYAVLAIGQDSFARIAYADQGSNMDFIQCTDIDCTSTSTSTVDSDEFDGTPSIAIGQDGFARIAYISPSQNLSFAQCTNSNCSTSNISVLDGDTSAVPAIAIGTDGFARISYTDENTDDLKFIQCTNAACTTGNTNIIVPGNSNFIQNDNIIKAPDRFLPEIVYTDNNGSLDLLQCTNSSL